VQYAKILTHLYDQQTSEMTLNCLATRAVYN